MIEDAIHDIFIYIWNNRTKLTVPDKIRPYLLVSLRHKLLKLLKKKSRVELKPDNESFSDRELSIEDRILEEEYAMELNSKLNEVYKLLSNRQREAVFLRYHENMSYEDICSLMNINYQSGRNLISTALKKMAAHLKK